MGFVFGYQNSSNFYLFDWKQSGQGYVGRTAAEGMTIKKFKGATGNVPADLSLEEFWENQVSFGDMTVLATNHATDKGWSDNRLYDFHLDFNLNPGEIHIVIKDGATVPWDRTVVDNTFPGGQFGFFNNSQAERSLRRLRADRRRPDRAGDPGAGDVSLDAAGLAAVGAVARRRRARG